MSTNVIGRCSECGGNVVVYQGPWMGINPPIPYCQSCFAHPKNNLPIIPMETNHNKYYPSYKNYDPGRYISYPYSRIGEVENWRY